jgi:hypothetical protein
MDGEYGEEEVVENDAELKAIENVENDEPTTM